MVKLCSAIPTYLTTTTLSFFLIVVVFKPTDKRKEHNCFQVLEASPKYSVIPPTCI